MCVLLPILKSEDNVISLGVTINNSAWRYTSGSSEFVNVIQLVITILVNSLNCQHAYPISYA